MNHLSHGQCRLPPDIRCMHGHEIIRVHNGVNQTIQHDGKINITVISNVNIQPIELEDMIRCESIKQKNNTRKMLVW